MEVKIGECLGKKQREQLLKEFPDAKIPKIEDSEELAKLMEQKPHLHKRGKDW